MGGRLKRADLDVHTSLTHTGGQRRLHANHTPILFKNEEASGAGVEDRSDLPLRRDGQERSRREAVKALSISASIGRDVVQTVKETESVCGKNWEAGRTLAINSVEDGETDMMAFQTSEAGKNLSSHTRLQSISLVSFLLVSLF